MKTTVKEKLDVMVARFGKMTFPELTKEVKKEIFDYLQLLAANYYSYTTQWEIEISTYQDFFYGMRPVLKKWSDEDVFADRQVLREISKSVIDFYLSKERIREFSFMSLSTGQTAYRPDKEHIANCESDAGSCMTSLGFLEDALSYYDQALSISSYYQGTRGLIYKSLRGLAKSYRASGRQIPKIDYMINKHISKIVDYEGKKICQIVLERRYRTDLPGWWYDSFKDALEMFAEMGFNEFDQHQLLLPVYEKVSLTLFNNFHMAYNPDNYNSSSKDYPCKDNSIELYRLLINEHSYCKWVLIYSIARQFDLEKKIAMFKSKKNDNAKIIAELETVRNQIKTIEG